MTTMLHCHVCASDKPPSDFYARELTRKTKRCRQCHLDAARAWGASNHQTDAYRERHTESQRRRRSMSTARQREVRHARKYRAKYGEKQKAKRAVATALKSGRLARPDRCGRCGSTPPPRVDGRAAIHAHHGNYLRPLDVEWLCVRCHGAEHRKASR